MTQNKAWMLKAFKECRIVWGAASLSPAYVGYTASDEMSCTPFFVCGVFIILLSLNSV